MPYALSGARHRGSRVPWRSVPRAFTWTRRLAGRAHTRDCAAADQRIGDRERPGHRIPRVCSREYAGIRGSRSYSSRAISNLQEAVADQGIQKVNGLVADLGVSRYQLTEPHRGFSILTDGPLDMRMDQTQRMTAGDLVNSAAEKAIADLIYQLGERKEGAEDSQSNRSGTRPIRSTLHLAGVVERAVPRTGRLHPRRARSWALRMAVNDEQGELDQLLEVAPGLIEPGGRIVRHFFHVSRRQKGQREVPQFGARRTRGGAYETPGDAFGQEVFDNPPSASAKLRAVEMK